MSKNYIYLIKSDTSYKIGISKNPYKRIKELQTGNSLNLELISIFETCFANKLEKTLHRTFEHLHDRGEWFFLSPDDIKGFIDLCEKCETNFNFLKENDNYYFNR